MVCQDYRTFAQRLTKNQNIVTLPLPAISPDLAPIGHVLDIFGCNVRYNHDVRQRLQMITALRLEWTVVPKNGIRNIIGLMRHRCTACMRADGGHISNQKLCDIQK